MEATEYIWLNGKFVKWDEAKVHVLTHTLHYGGGAFEGIRVYNTAKGSAAFRLDRHIDRLFYSAEAVAMKVPFSKAEIAQACKQLVSKNKLAEAYLRPLIYYGYGVMGINPTLAPVEATIACWEWGQYLPHDMVDLKISKYCRISPDALIADAKICGHYVNSILAAIEVRDTHYHEALLLDDKGFIAEGPGENFFLVKDGKLATPKLRSILAGITRETVIQIARDLGYEVAECELSPQDAATADEAFFTGTAAEVTPIRSIDDKVLGTGETGPLTQKIKQTYLDAVCGKKEQYLDFLDYI